MTDLNVTLIQTELSWEDKTRNLAHFAELISAAKQETDLIILPEMFSTGFSMKPEKFAEQMDGASIEWMRQQAKATNAIVTGSIIVEEKSKYFNRLIWAQPDGAILHYDKRHLFGMSNEHEHYTAGKEKLIVEWKEWKICPLVCYDLRFPVWCRNTENYDLALFVANWPERRNMAWKNLLVARAIENQAYIVGVNRIGNDGTDIYHSGDSSLIDPMGEVVFTQADLPFVKTFTLTKQRLNYVRDKLPFLNDRDDFTIKN